MRPAKSMMSILVIGVFAWSDPALAELPKGDTDGWHSWTIDTESSETLYVRLKSGKPVEIRNVRVNCAPVPRGQVVADHGVVSAEENFTWFRRIFENKTFSRRIREGALHGLALSDSDQAFNYLDDLLMGE